MRGRSQLLGILFIVLVAACGSKTDAPAAARTTGERAADGAQRTLVIGITGAVQAFGLAGATTPIGGWMSTGEIHSQGLVTADRDTRRPVGQLAERAPSLQDGTMAIQADGRMRVIYMIRPGISWQDGTPFTTKDLEFSYQVNSDPGLPFISRDATQYVSSIETPDDRTFALLFNSPYFMADSIGLRLFWPYPRHILGEAYERFRATKDSAQFVGESYWTSDYVNLGPYRPGAIEPGESVTFRAYDGYFQGRPRIDTIHVRTFGDENALFAAVLAGAVDVFMDLAVSPELGHQLKERLESSGDGRVHNLLGYTRFMQPQWRPETQREPGILDQRVRAALYHALDRRAIAEAVQAGRADLVADALLPTNHRNFEGTKDAMRQYVYAPDRSRALLQEAGFAQAADGGLRSATDGHRFWTSVWANARWTQENALIGDYWRRHGVEVEEYVIPASRARDQEYRSTYPGWYTSSRYGDGITAPLDEPPAGPENRWTGNSSGYDSQAARRLTAAYTGSLSSSDQIQAIRALGQFVAAELPILLMYYEADHIGVRTGINALDDVQGGAGSGAGYGLYTRNVHLWSIAR